MLPIKYFDLYKIAMQYNVIESPLFNPQSQIDSASTITN